jgi:hypothetical protein
MKLLFTLLLGVAIGFMSNYVFFSGGDLILYCERPDDNLVKQNNMKNSPYSEANISHSKKEEFISE